MLNRVYQTKFVKDVARAKKRGKDVAKLSAVINLLLAEQPLVAKYKNHKLQGQYKDYWECHLEPDWLPISQNKNRNYICQNGNARRFILNPNLYSLIPTCKKPLSWDWFKVLLYGDRKNVI